MKIIKRVLQWFKSLFISRKDNESKYIPKHRVRSYKDFIKAIHGKYSGFRKYTKAPAIS